MIYRQTGLQGFTKLLIFSIFVVMSVAIAVHPQAAQAEGNEPTFTPTVSVTLPPTDTPMPTETPQEEGTDLEAKNLENPGDAVALSAGSTEPEARSWVTTPNLCLIGAIVVVAIGVIVMVVLGVMRTVGVQNE